MSLSDDLIRQKQADEAAIESIKLRQQEWSIAIGALLSTIEEMLAAAIEAQAISVTRGETTLGGGRVPMPTLSIARSTSFGRLPIKPVSIEPVGMSRVRIQGGAVVGYKTALSWNGSQNGLSSWSVPPQSSGSREMRNGNGNRHRVNGAGARPLTPGMLETVLRRYLGLGECA
jgi:hypothetical protein